MKRPPPTVPTVKLTPEMKAAMMLIDTMTTKFQADEFRDQYRERVLALIEARAQGKKLPKGKAAAPPTNVLDLMDVLQRSLRETKKKAASGAEGDGEKAAARAVKPKGPVKARPRRAHAKTSAA